MTKPCNCPEKVECGVELTFDIYSTGLISMLSVGNLINIGQGHLGGYVIDWYKDGVLLLTSASDYGLAPDSSVYHPLIGSAAIPLAPGVYNPIVRFVIFNGQKIFPKPRICQKWCEMNINLPTAIEVMPLNCNTVLGSPLSGYTAAISYRTTQDYNLAKRTLFFSLDEDAWAFAVNFDAAHVADHCKIIHSRTGEVLFDWIVGTLNNSYEYFGYPHSIAGTAIKAVFRLPQYQVGDYLIIDIFPSVKETNYNTEWTLNLVCLKNQPFTPPVISDLDREYDIDTINLIWDETLCGFYLSMKFNGTLPTVESETYGKYTGMRPLIFSSAYYINGGLYSGVYMSYFSRNLSIYTSVEVGYSSKISITQPIVISKSANVITISCVDKSDYDDLKYGYNYIMSRSFATGYVNDPTNINYYRWFRFVWFITNNACGDDETRISFDIHISSIFEWDDINRMVKITVPYITLQIPKLGDCDGAYGALSAQMTSINRLYNADNFSYSTKCRYKYPFGLGYYCGFSLPTIRTSPSGRGIATLGVDVIPDSVGGTWSLYGANYVWFHSLFALEITATRNSDGSWLQDPLQNFEVYNYINHDTGELLSFPQLIYKIVNGIATVKKQYNDNT